MTARDEQLPSQIPTSDTLNGWKEIAQHFGRSVRTVQRWERDYALPIHRIEAARGEILWASREELEQWRANRSVDPASTVAEAAFEPAMLAADTPSPTAAASHIFRRWWIWFAAASVTIAACLALNTWFFRLQLSTAGPLMRAQGETFPFDVTGFTRDGSVTRWTRLPNGNVEAIGDAIRVGPEGRMAWSLTTDCATESGTHRLWMVDDRSGRRSNEIEAIVLPNPACSQPTVDLAARAVTIDRVSIRPGDTVNVEYEIWNLGTAPAVATTTRLRLGTESMRSRVTDAPLGDHPAPALDAGGRASQRVEVRLPNGTAPGVYYVWVVADNGSLTIESSSFNNFARSAALLVTPVK